MIRVLQVIGSLNAGGSQAAIMNVYRHIDRSQIQFDFMIFHDDERMLEKEIKRLGGKVFYIEAFNGKNLFRFIKDWISFLAGHSEYRIVHGHVRSVAAIYLFIAKKMGRTVIAHSHSTSNGKKVSGVIKNVMQYPVRYIADYLFACSEEAGRWMYGKKACTGKRYYYFPNAIDISLYQYKKEKREAVRKKLNIDGNIVVGTVGRICEAKNPYGILEIMEGVRKKNNKVVFVWVGDGELGQKIKREASGRGMSDDMLFLGNRSDVPDLLQAFDIFLFPSCWEGMPVAVIEAQAAGLPCLISDRITRRAGVSDLVRFLPIDHGYEIWEEAVLSADLDRKDVSEQIREAGFDLCDTAKWLQEFYVKLQGKNIAAVEKVAG